MPEQPDVLMAERLARRYEEVLVDAIHRAGPSGIVYSLVRIHPDGLHHVFVDGTGADSYTEEEFLRRVLQPMLAALREETAHA